MTLPNPQVKRLARHLGVWLFIFVFITSFEAAAQAVAVDAASISQRIGQMERRLMAVENVRFPGGLGNGSAATGGAAVADMELRLQDLENEISSLNGAVERLGKVVQTLAEKMDAQQKDLELRLQDLENAGGRGGNGGGMTGGQHTDDGGATVAVPGPISGTVKKVTPAEAAKVSEVPAGASAQEIYSKGYGYLTAADYAKAKTWLGALVERHPKDALSDNGYYWLGEIALVQNNPTEAAVQFKKGLEAFPKGQKAPGNLLKMGVALEKLGKADLAKGMWEKLRKDYPKAAEAAKAKEYLDKLAKPAAAAPAKPDAAPVAKKN